MKNNNESKQEYLDYLINCLRYPDFDIYKRVKEIPNDEMLTNLEEENIINIFTNKFQFQEIRTGSFYKCRKLGIITRYDKEVFDGFNTSAFIYLIFCLITGKVFSSSLAQFKYILPTSESRIYLLSTFGLISSGIIYIYQRKKNLDRMLDKKYSSIYQNFLNKFNKSDIINKNTKIKYN